MATNENPNAPTITSGSDGPPTTGEYAANAASGALRGAVVGGALAAGAAAAVAATAYGLGIGGDTVANAVNSTLDTVGAGNWIATGETVKQNMENLKNAAEALSDHMMLGEVAGQVSVATNPATVEIAMRNFTEAVGTKPELQEAAKGVIEAAGKLLEPSTTAGVAAAAAAAGGMVGTVLSAPAGAMAGIKDTDARYMEHVVLPGVAGAALQHGVNIGDARRQQMGAAEETRRQQIDAAEETRRQQIDAAQRATEAASEAAARSVLSQPERPVLGPWTRMAVTQNAERGVSSLQPG